MASVQIKTLEEMQGLLRRISDASKAPKPQPNVV